MSQALEAESPCGLARCAPEPAALAAHRPRWTCRRSVLSSGRAEPPRLGEVLGPGPSFLINGAPSSGGWRPEDAQAGSAV